MAHRAFYGQFASVCFIKLKKKSQMKTSSLSDAVDGQIEWLLGGNTPVVCLQTQLVVTQSGLVKNWEPLH